MSASVNKVILIGRLGKDPEVRYTGGGAAVANFSLATDESYKDKSGEKQKKTEWHNLVVWGKSVEGFVQPYLHKGDLVYIEGKLQTREWTDKEGQKRYTTEINVTNINSLESRGSSDSPVNKQGNSRGPISRPTGNGRSTRPEPEPSSEIDDSDIPF